MPRVRCDIYSQYYDPKTRATFGPVTDLQTGTKVGVAEVSAKVAAGYKGREGFRVISDAEYQAMTERKPKPAPTEPVTGDPLGDAAKGEGAPKPPEPPKG